MRMHGVDSRKMRVIAWCAAIFSLALVALVLLTSNTTAMHPAYLWHIQGKVVDGSTNALPNVSVLASGKINFTLANLLFGTHVKTYSMETNTDERGHFLLSFSALGTSLTFHKDGYHEANLDFAAYEGLTNPPFSSTTQYLNIVLKPLAGVQKARDAN